MPKTKFHQSSKPSQGNIEPTVVTEPAPVETEDLMADFEPTDRKDLSYRGKQKRTEERTEHLLKKLKEINEQLKADSVRVTIRKSGETALTLRATLPLKPGDTNSSGAVSKSYDISLGIPFNKEGLVEARRVAYELSRLMTTKTFQWTDEWLGSKSLSKKAALEKPKSFGEALEEFKVKYFLTRKRNRQSEKTLKTHLESITPNISSDLPFTADTITKAIHGTDAGSAKRYTTVNVLSVICKTLKLEYDFKGLANGYEPKDKKLPTDGEVLKYYEVFQPNSKRLDSQWESWQWLYGILATYGLRIHEVWAIDMEKFLDPSNVENIITLDERLTEGLKTGDRQVFPYHPEWVELFKLKDVKMPVLGGNLHQKSRVTCTRFVRSKIPFTPHTLRHAYAVRGYKLGIPAKEMADSMGHDLSTHTKTYQKYMTLDDRKDIVKKALSKNKVEREHKSEMEVLRERVRELETILVAKDEEIERLKTELRLVREMATM